MRARATRTLLVAWDGIRAERLEEGTLLEGERAGHAVEQGFAAEERDAGAAPVTADAGPPPENKAAAPRRRR